MSVSSVSMVLAKSSILLLIPRLNYINLKYTSACNSSHTVCATVIMSDTPNGMACYEKCAVMNRSISDLIVTWLMIYFFFLIKKKNSQTYF